MDSGDLAYLSIEARNFFNVIEKEFGVAHFGKMVITASNNLNEETIDALNKQAKRCKKSKQVNKFKANQVSSFFSFTLM